MTIPDMCQCPHPEVVIEGESYFCAWCGGDLDPAGLDLESAALALNDLLNDVSDVLLCTRFETSL